MIFLNSASSAAALVFYLPGLCTNTDTERKQRKARVRNILKKSEKNTIFNEHPVSYEHDPVSYMQCKELQSIGNTLYLISFACVISHMALTPSTIMCQLFFLLNSLVFHRKIRGVSQKYCDPPPPFLPLLLLILVDCRQSSVIFCIFLLQTRHRDRKKPVLFLSMSYISEI